MRRIGGWKKFGIVAGIDLVILGCVLLLGAPLKYSLIGFAIIAFLEYAFATTPK